MCLTICESARGISVSCLKEERHVWRVVKITESEALALLMFSVTLIQPF